MLSEKNISESMKKQMKKMKKMNIPVFVIVLIVLTFFSFANIFGPQDTKTELEELYGISQTELTLSDFVKKYQDKNFETVVLQNEILLK